MENFNVISFTELMRQGDCQVDATQQNQRTARKVRFPSEVYIQDINGKLWETEDWDNSVKPNAIAIITDETKFLMALEQSDLQMSNICQTDFDEYMFAALTSHVAIKNYDGAGNTVRMLKAQSSTDYAAGYCNAFTFPDGKTKGYLPSLGQLYLACRNKGEVNAALSKCGGTAMADSYYWSSTFWGNNQYNYRSCWVLGWNYSDIFNVRLIDIKYVRPFADF